MKYIVPPIVIPVLLVIGIAGYAMFKGPLGVHHPHVPAVNSQPR